jgi:hypothetical protein
MNILRIDERGCEGCVNARRKHHVSDESDLRFPRDSTDNETTEVTKDYFSTRGFRWGGTIVVSEVYNPKEG